MSLWALFRLRKFARGGKPVNEFEMNFSAICGEFSNFITEFLPAVCSCPAFVFIGALCGAIGIVKLTWYLADC